MLDNTNIYLSSSNSKNHLEVLSPNTISTVTKKTKVPVTSSSHSSDLASKFLNFLDIPHTDVEIFSPLDVHVHHEVPRTQAPTLLKIPVSVITESSPMTTLAEYIIVAGAENRPLMLEKSMYDSWTSQNGQTRPMKYSKLTDAQQLQDDCDVQATNIILHGLPPDVYALVNHQEVAKDIWDRGETLYEYYWRFSQLINDMHTIGMTMQQVQVNTKFLNGSSLPSNETMFVTDGYAGTGNRGITTTSKGNYAAGQPRIITVKENGIWKRSDTFDEETLDAYDSDCDDLSSAKAIMMANLSSCDPEVLYKESQDAVIQDTNSFAPNDLLVLSLVEQMTDHVDHLDKENQANKMVNESLTAELERYKERVIIFEQRLNVDLNKHEKLIDSQMDDLIRDKNAKLAAFQQEIDTLKETLSNNVKERVIRKLKDRIKSLSRKDSLENVKKDIDEIETINIELEHSQFDSIRKTRVQSKEHCVSLIAQINAKSVENSDLNAQLQEKGFAITALKNELRKLKGKNVVDTAVSNPNATIAPGMFKLDIEPISHRLKNNRDAHETCLTSPKPSEKLVAVTPMNKDKRVRFAEPVTSSSNIPKQIDSLKTKDSNKPLLTSIRVKHTTSVSGSKPLGNTKNNRISQPPSSNQKNKVEDHFRKVKSSLNRILSLNLSVMHLLSILWEMLMPPKETTIAPVVTPTSGILVYSRRLKATRSVGSSSKVKIVESKTSNSKEPKQSWESIVSDVPSSSLNDCRFENDHIANIMGYGDYQMENFTISQVYYMEGLEAVATACYTQNRSFIRKHHNKTPYELLHDQKLELSYLHVFGALCYPTNDGEDLGKLKPKANIGIFVGYVSVKKAF
ncbi:retrovirus-related pol polyprotein from transposon TNT 1-94 [Tanacetum coccineum]